MGYFLHADLSRRHPLLRVLVEEPGTEREALVAYQVTGLVPWHQWMDPDVIACAGAKLEVLWHDEGVWHTPRGEEWDSPEAWLEHLIDRLAREDCPGGAGPE